MGPRLQFHSSGVRGRLCPMISTRNWNGAVYADDCNIYVRSRRAGERVVAINKADCAGTTILGEETKIDCLIGSFSFLTLRGYTCRRNDAPPNGLVEPHRARECNDGGGREMAGGYCLDVESALLGATAIPPRSILTPGSPRSCLLAH